MQKQAEWILCPVCGNKTRDRTRYKENKVRFIIQIFQ